jgi:hypothetical protein
MFGSDQPGVDKRRDRGRRHVGGVGAVQARNSEPKRKRKTSRSHAVIAGDDAAKERDRWAVDERHGAPLAVFTVCNVLVVSAKKATA